MHPNPVLRKLGFSVSDRVAIIHADDIGMCQASLAAFQDLWESNSISSAATMVPCPWFPGTANYCRSHIVDMGIHTTLNSEWDVYRWGPLSTRDYESGLLDEEGFLPRTVKEVQEAATPTHVRDEIQMQLSRALNAGIDVTHIDTHMGTVTHPRFVQDYVQLALDQKLPVMVPRQDEAGFRRIGLDEQSARIAAQLIGKLETIGIPLIDNIFGLPLDQPEDRLEQARLAFTNLPPGITHFIIHPSVDTPELRAITPDWRGRVADYETFLSKPFQAFLKTSGVQVIGYRMLRDLFRKHPN
jgi:predicted glycoside hydrolase/deacetylase ChbG (UPF0249 family)